MDQYKNIKGFLKCFLANMVIITLICLIYVSGTLAQWPSYSNAGWFSQPFLSSSFFSLNTISNYGVSFNNSFYLPYMDLLSPGSWSNSYPWQNAPLLPQPYYPSAPSVVNVTSNNGYTSIIPVPRYEPKQRDAPRKLNGKWQSQESIEEGNLEIDRGSDKILAMEGASPPLGKGSLTEFHYTPKSGKSPISFKAEFDSDYTAEFTGTANNRLGCEGCVYAWYSRDVHNFKVEGEYVVKDDSGNVTDKGTFSLIGY